MILRFKSATYPASEARYCAINTDTQTYVTDPEIVKQGRVLELPANHFEDLIEEIDFNCWNYAETLFEPVEVEDMPF